MRLFQGLFDSELTQVISVSDFLICVAVSLLLGAAIAGAYRYRNRCTGSFLSTLAMLPAVVCVVIMTVNGNVGTGVAVAGAFSLVRFRSIPGTAKEIGALFLAMGVGVLTGMGYIAYAVLFAGILCGVSMLYARFSFGSGHRDALYKTLRITIPENLDYETVFDGILTAYTESFELTAVKTTDMGSLYKLTYDLKMKKAGLEKTMIDSLRCKNGNLEILLSRQETGNSGL